MRKMHLSTKTSRWPVPRHWVWIHKRVPFWWAENRKLWTWVLRPWGALSLMFLREGQQRPGQTWTPSHVSSLETRTFKCLETKWFKLSLGLRHKLSNWDQNLLLKEKTPCFNFFLLVWLFFFPYESFCSLASKWSFNRINGICIHLP